MICAVFPGQGNQSIGMGKDFYDGFPRAKAMYDFASDKTSIDIKGISFEGPKEVQDNILNCQLITFVNSCVMFELLGREFDHLAGHSIGEYTALYSAEVFSFERGLEIVKKRGELMRTVSFGGSCMVAVIGEERETIEDFCRETEGALAIALYNSPGNYVIAGTPENIDGYFDKIPGKKIKLNVTGPSHTKHCRTISEEYREFLKGFAFNEPRGIVYSNYSVGIYTKDNIIDNLVNQLWHPVLWEQIVRNIPCNTFVEIGPGKSLKRMIERTREGVKVLCIQKCDGLEQPRIVLG